MWQNLLAFAIDMNIIVHVEIIRFWQFIIHDKIWYFFLFLLYFQIFSWCYFSFHSFLVHKHDCRSHVVRFSWSLTLIELKLCSAIPNAAKMNHHMISSHANAKYIIKSNDSNSFKSSVLLNDKDLVLNARHRLQ